MRILIVDREEITTELMRSRLEPLGHKIIQEEVKNTAVDRLAEEHFDMIFLDPAPLTSSRPLILNMRRASAQYPYIVHMGDIPHMEAVQSGANDRVTKPIDPEELDQAVGNARYLIALVKRIGDETEDFPSAGGIIAKSAFNQLFLSAIDRADRYGEQTYVVFIGIKNYQTILETEGVSNANYAAAKLSKYLVRLRRQSDIIAQTEKGEFALLLQRPLYETEPMEAANRFAEAVMNAEDLFKADGAAPEFYIKLIDLPGGSRLIEHHVTKDHT